MSNSFRYLKLSLLLCGFAVGVGSMSWLTAASAQADAQAEFFEKQIRPLFATQCAACHNPKAQVAQLDLTTAEGFAKGGESGTLVNKDNPEESRLLKVISYHETLKMPPKGKLKDEEIAAITTWVKVGAYWPGAKAPVVEAAANAKPSTTRPFTEAEKAFWSFQPLARPAVPAVKNKAWVKSPIDAFVLQQLEAKNIQPAAPADKLTLLRRATYD
ncbi:MAG: c-type cytochrome, partial [Acidobacteria bacterium]|nr:c-type cytochrome [Acidobacteriota bacterium]